MSREHAQIHKLREKILAGSTTYADMERRLIAAIEAEYDKENADIDLINALEDLLLEMHTGGDTPAFPTAEKYAEGMRRHLQTAQKRPVLPRLTWRCIAALAAVLAVIFLGGEFFHWRWFSGSSTPDAQQYVIQGHEVSVPIIAESIAEHNGEMLHTDKWEEVVEFLGFTPATFSPGLLPSDHIEHVVMADSESIILSSRFFATTSSKSSLMLRIQYFGNNEDAYVLFEQDALGEKFRINGHDVYIATNLDNIAFTWQTDSIIYRLVGNIDQNTGEKLVSDLIRR